MLPKACCRFAPLNSSPQKPFYLGHPNLTPAQPIIAAPVIEGRQS